jgi:hypothetical protein
MSLADYARSARVSASEPYSGKHPRARKGGIRGRKREELPGEAQECKSSNWFAGGSCR